MARKLFCFFILMVTMMAISISAQQAGGGKTYFRFNRDPQNPGGRLPDSLKGEYIVVTDKDIDGVTVNSGSGKAVGPHTISAGTAVGVDKNGFLRWIVICSNDVLSPKDLRPSGVAIGKPEDGFVDIDPQTKKNSGKEDFGSSSNLSSRVVFNNNLVILTGTIPATHSTATAEDDCTEKVLIFNKEYRALLKANQIFFGHVSKKGKTEITKCELQRLVEGAEFREPGWFSRNKMGLIVGGATTAIVTYLLMRGHHNNSGGGGPSGWPPNGYPSSGGGYYTSGTVRLGGSR